MKYGFTIALSASKYHSVVKIRKMGLAEVFFFVLRTYWACGLSFYRTNLDWPPEEKLQDNHYTAYIHGKGSIIS